MKKSLGKFALVLLFISLVFARPGLSQGNYNYIGVVKYISDSTIHGDVADYFGVILKQVINKYPGNNDKEKAYHELYEQCKAFCHFFNIERPVSVPEGIFNNMQLVAMTCFIELDSDLRLISSDWVKTENMIKKLLRDYINTHRLIIEL